MHAVIWRECVLLAGDVLKVTRFLCSLAPFASIRVNQRSPRHRFGPAAFLEPESSPCVCVHQSHARHICETAGDRGTGAGEEEDEDEAASVAHACGCKCRPVICGTQNDLALWCNGAISLLFFLLSFFPVCRLSFPSSFNLQ